MKYAPKLPGKNDNISHKNPLAEFILLCTGLAAVFGGAYFLLGFFVDMAAESISFEAESALFSYFEDHYQFGPEKESSEMIRLQQLVDELQRCTRIPYPITVHIVDSDEANAIAMPGGHILVFQGLLKAVPGDSGLAFVLAHELGHFSNRDHLSGLGRSLVLFSLAALLTGGDSSLSGMFAPSTAISSAQYSQTRETLADTFALDTLFCFQGSVQGATDFFEHIQKNESVMSGKLFQYFSSHPQTTDRISEMLSYAKEKGYLQQ